MPSDFDNAPATKPPVFARPDRNLYVIIGIWALAGVGISLAVWLIPSEPTPARPDAITPAQILAMMTAIFFLPCAVMVWLMRRLRLAADARGLWIRSFFKTQFIEWQGIEDYELRPPARYGQQTDLSWICAKEKWQRLPTLHDNMDALRARIQAEATSSRAREWQLNIARDDTDDWPRVYAYRDPSGRRSFWLAFAGLLLYFGYAFSGAFSSDAPATIRYVWDGLEGWGRVAFVLAPLLFLAMFALWLLPIYAAMRAKKGLGAPTIRADQTGLTRPDAESQTRIAWAEITDYFIEDVKGPMTLHQCVVESASTRLVFQHEITGFIELKTMVEARAVNAKSSEWLARESADDDTLGGEPSLWTGGAPGVGRKIYHYRTRTTRAMIFLGGAMMTIMLVAGISSYLRERWVLSELLIPLVFFVPFATLTLGGALAFWRASIQTDENGLTQISIWGERFLRWDEIESFTCYDYFYQVKGATTVIRYGTVAASDTLRAEIEARSGHKMSRNGQRNDDE